MIVLALADRLPSTPSRKTPVQFDGRLASGGLSGVAISFGMGSTWIGLMFGMAGP